MTSDIFSISTKSTVSIRPIYIHFTRISYVFRCLYTIFRENCSWYWKTS